MNPVDSTLSFEQRARLAEKGRILYRKSCGVNGEHTCADGFALYHIRRGEPEVARDLLAFLESEVEVLRSCDRDARLAHTLELAARIRTCLESNVSDADRSE